MYRNLALFFAPFSRLSVWSLTQAYLCLREFLVSYGTGNILPTLFPKVALGPSNSTFLLVFHTLTVSDTASASPLIIELPLKGRIVIIKVMNKNKGHCACFCGSAADSAHHLHFLWGLIEDWGEFQSGMYVVGGRHHWKIRFYGIYIEIKQLGHNVIKMKLKCPESGSAQHPLSKASVRQFNSVIDIILIMFLQKLFFFHGGNLVMRVTKMWNLLGNQAMCKDISCTT